MAAHGRPEGVDDDERADRLRRRRAAERGAESGRPGAGAAAYRDQRHHRGRGQCRHSAGERRACAGALTLGSAVPHLLNALPLLGPAGMPPWRTVLLTTSGSATIAAMIAASFI